MAVASEMVPQLLDSPEPHPCCSLVFTYISAFIVLLYYLFYIAALLVFPLGC